MSQKRIYLTPPIYYVNGRPHLGQAYTTITTDLLARFHRLAGRETFFLTGTDEHGTKIAEAAAEAKMETQAFCDLVVEQFKQTWASLGINYDGFIRTTSPRHLDAVRKILDAMRAARTDDGLEVVYSNYYEGLYCNECEKFITAKDLVDGVCPDHKTVPEQLKEKNYFFRLSAFLPKIKELILSGELEILPEERRREVLGLINQDLPDFSLSRERVEWGIPLSFDDSQVAYVWVDALSNYISAIGYADDTGTFDKWWNKAEIVHLMAKDILKFHCLYWPAMLLAAGVKLPETIFLHGFFTVNGDKMSKTLGNFIDPNDMVEEFGPDATRYLLLTQYPFGGDGDIQANRFALQYNSDLANDLGNLVSRVCKMVQTRFDSLIPEKFDEIDGLPKLAALTDGLAERVYEHICQFRLHQAISESMNLVRATNKFFADAEPWKLKDESELAKLGGILRACCETIRIVSVLMYPLMPSKMIELRRSLGLSQESLNLAAVSKLYGIQTGQAMNFEKPLFPRVEKKEGKEIKGNQKDPKENTESGESAVDSDNLIDIDQFFKTELRVAQIITAELVEGADKLLLLQVDVGQLGKRQIVAGIAKHYQPEDLPGKKIVLVVNLKPAKIKGLLSNGMLLAASTKSKLALVTPEGDLPPGAKIG